MAVVARFKFEVEDVGAGIVDAMNISQAFDEAGGMTSYEVATGVTDQAMPISTTTGVTTTQALYFRSDQNVTLRQAAADTGLTIRANLPMLLTGTAITALLVSNASGSTANIRYRVWGT